MTPTAIGQWLTLSDLAMSTLQDLQCQQNVSKLYTLIMRRDGLVVGAFASEADDTGSIPGKANFRLLRIQHRANWRHLTEMMNE